MESAHKLRQRAGRVREPVTLGALLNREGSALPGLVLVLTAIPSLLPVPGVGNVTGIALVVMAVSIWNGCEGLMLPRRVAGLCLTAAQASRLLRGLAWLLELGKRWLSPRGDRWLGPRSWAWSAWPVAVMGVIIFLPIPLGNVLGALSLVALGLGHSAEDGLAVLAGWVLSTLTVVYSLALSWGLAIAGQALWASWFGT